MKLTWATRRRWALVLLLVGLPLYVVAAVTVMNRLGRPGILVELLVYVALGILWAIPFRFVFLGIGRPDPDAASRQRRDERRRRNFQRDPPLGDGAAGVAPYSADGVPDGDGGR